MAKKYQDHLLSEKNHWVVLKYVKDMKISAAGFEPMVKKFSLKKWDVLILPVTLLFVVTFIIKLVIWDVWLGYAIMIVPFVVYDQKRRGKMSFTTPRKTSLLRGVITAGANSSTIASFITDVKIRKSFDSMHLNLAHAADADSNGESFISIEHFKVPPSMDENLEDPKELPTVFMRFK